MKPQKARSRGFFALRILALALAYFIGGKLGLSLPYLSSNITLFWPPAGIALAAVLSWGWRCWPGIAAGALMVNLTTGELGLPAAVAVALGNTLGPLLCAMMLTRATGFSFRLNRARDVLMLTLVAPVGMSLTATVGVIALRTADALASDLTSLAWLGWWLGDTAGMLVFAPPLLAWAACREDASICRDPRFGPEFLLAMGVCGAAAWAVFGDVLALGPLKLSLGFLVFPPLIWSTLRFDVFGASSAALIVAVIAVWGTARGVGPFTKGYFPVDQVVLCVFVGTTALVSSMIIGIQAACRNAERTLRDSESRLRLALAAGNHGLYDINVQTGEVEVSPEYALMLGYDPKTFEETLADWRERLHPDEREPVLRTYEDYVAGLRDDYHAEFRQLTRNGDWKWIVSMGKIVEWDEQGRPLRLLGTHTDISERKAREIALAQSEGALDQAQALAKLGSWRLDLAEDMLVWSKETYRIFGLEDETPLNYADFLAFVVPEDRELVDRAWRNALQGEPYDLEHRINVHGQIKWVRERARLESDKSGNLLKALGTVQDISELKGAEEEARRARALLRTVIDATPDWIFVKDREHRFLLVNNAFAESQGLEPVQMLGRPDTDFWSPHLCHGDPAQGIRGFHADDDEAFSGKATHNPADAATLADGRLRWFDTLKLPMRDENGDIKGVLAYARDITERMNAESKYRTLVEQIPAITYIAAVEPLARTVFISPQIESHLGFSVQDWLDDPQMWEKQLHPDDRERVMAELNNSLARLGPYRSEYRIFRKDGGIAWIRDGAAWLTDALGKPVLLQGVMTDISDRKRTEEDLNRLMQELLMSESQQRRLLTLARTEQSRMSALLSAMRIGILFEDNDRWVEYVNPAFLRMWGIDGQEDLIGMPSQAVFERSAADCMPPLPHAGEIAEQREIELSDGRVLTRVSYPINDHEGQALGRIWIFEDVTQERRTAQQLLYLAERDPLTGLYNRHRFQEQLEHLISASRRNGGKFALLYFDLDDFKYINDTFGHRAGDIVLVRAAGEISNIVRQIEIFARLGGDEFAILSTLQAGQDVSALPARIIATIASIPLRFGDTNLRLTSSVGVAVFPEHGETSEDLIAHADAAMYQAKNRGKNTWTLYDPSRDSSQAMVHRMSWYNRIAQALESELFEIHFQGVYETAGNSLTHLEVLVRMRDPNDSQNLIMPAQFIPIAEKSGQIVSIDRWVLRQAIQLLSENPNIPPLAINISGRTFDDPILPCYIQDLLKSYHVDPARIIIELTETAAVSDIQDAQRFIEAIQQAGCRVCLDDFGTGFSTFGYLKYLGVEILKIDGVFIRDLPKNRDNQIFVKAMVEIARGLGKKTVSEFVEDEATLEMVKSLGIDLVQGYYLGRPKAEIPDVSFGL